MGLDARDRHSCAHCTATSEPDNIVLSLHAGSLTQAPAADSMQHEPALDARMHAAAARLLSSRTGQLPWSVPQITSFHSAGQR